MVKIASLSSGALSHFAHVLKCDDRRGLDGTLQLIHTEPNVCGVAKGVDHVVVDAQLSYIYQWLVRAPTGDNERFTFFQIWCTCEYISTRGVQHQRPISVSDPINETLFRAESRWKVYTHKFVSMISRPTVISLFCVTVFSLSLSFPLSKSRRT